MRANNEGNCWVPCLLHSPCRSCMMRVVHRYRHAAIASWWAKMNFIPPTIENAGMPRKRSEMKSRRECPGLQWEACSVPAAPWEDYLSFVAVLCNYTEQQQQPQPPQLHRPATSLEAQATTRTESVSSGS
jgi:hypothetical protein